MRQFRNVEYRRRRVLNASTSKITATKGTNLPVGYFVTAVASGTTSCPILLGANLQASAS